LSYKLKSLSENNFNMEPDFYRNPEVASEHSRSHELEDRISSLAYFTVDPANFDAQDSTIPCVSAKCAFQHREKHYHCLWVSQE
jgi:hypothetical protein